MCLLAVSKNRGIPKWMVYNGKPYQNGWFWGTTIFGNTLYIDLGSFPQQHSPDWSTVHRHDATCFPQVLTLDVSPLDMSSPWQGRITFPSGAQRHKPKRLQKTKRLRFGGKFSPEKVAIQKPNFAVAFNQSIESSPSCFFRWNHTSWNINRACQVFKVLMALELLARWKTLPWKSHLWILFGKWLISPLWLPSLKLTAKAPENRPGPKRKLILQPFIFRCELLVSARVDMWVSWRPPNHLYRFWFANDVPEWALGMFHAFHALALGVSFGK